MKSPQLALFALALPAPAFAGVLVVDASGAGDYTTLGAAISAASSGDVLLMKSGSYDTPDPLVFPAMDLSIVADEGALVQVGELELAGLAAGQRFILSGLIVTADEEGTMDALRFDDVAGSIRIQNCTISSPFGGALSAYSCEDIVVNQSTLSSGQAPPDDSGEGRYGSNGLLLWNSTAAIFDCSLSGGDGGDGYPGGLFVMGNGGSGGAGAWLHSDSLLYAMGCEFEGGDGGLGFMGGTSGNGGTGVYMVVSSEAHLAQPVFSPGTGPESGIEDPFLGPGVVFLNEIRRELQGPNTVREGQPYTWTIIGRPGDRVFIPESSTTRWRWLPPLGVLTLAGSINVGGQLGIIGPGTSLTINAVAPTLPTGVEAHLTHKQVFVLKSNGTRLLGGAQVLHVLDSSF